MIFLLVLVLGFHLSFGIPKLVSPRWLAEHLDRKDVVVLEFSDSQSYLMEGHVPGAILTEKEDWRVMDEATGALVRKSVEEYERMFRSWGIDNDSQVVLYYKGNRMNEILGAVYAYWIFHLLGHRKVGILDGGWQAWLKGRYPVSYEEPQVSEGSFRASYDPRKEIDARYLLENVGRKPIIDGRPVEHYFGISKFPAAKKYGHVPCSVPLPWEWWIRKDEETGKLYLEFPRYVAEFLRNQGISEDEEVLLFCFGGTGAAFLYMVMDILGYRGMRVYDASKREWEALDLPLNRYLWETFEDCRVP